MEVYNHDYWLLQIGMYMFLQFVIISNVPPIGLWCGCRLDLSRHHGFVRYFVPNFRIWLSEYGNGKRDPQKIVQAENCFFLSFHIHREKCPIYISRRWWIQSFPSVLTFWLTFTWNLQVGAEKQANKALFYELGLSSSTNVKKWRSPWTPARLKWSVKTILVLKTKNDRNAVEKSWHGHSSLLLYLHPYLYLHLTLNFGKMTPGKMLGYKDYYLCLCTYKVTDPESESVAALKHKL